MRAQCHLPIVTRLAPTLWLISILPPGTPSHQRAPWGRLWPAHDPLSAPDTSLRMPAVPSRWVARADYLPAYGSDICRRYGPPNNRQRPNSHCCQPVVSVNHAKIVLRYEPIQLSVCLVFIPQIPNHHYSIWNVSQHFSKCIADQMRGI